MDIFTVLTVTPNPKAFITMRKHCAVALMSFFSGTQAAKQKVPVHEKRMVLPPRRLCGAHNDQKEAHTAHVERVDGVPEDVVSRTRGPVNLAKHAILHGAQQCAGKHD